MKKVMFVIMAAAVVLASCNSSETKNVPTSDSIKVVTVNLDSIQVADSSVMVLDSTVSKIGK